MNESLSHSKKNLVFHPPLMSTTEEAECEENISTQRMISNALYDFSETLHLKRVQLLNKENAHVIMQACVERKQDEEPLVEEPMSLGSS